MSAENGNGDADDGGDDSPGRREVAYRVFAAEFDDSDFDYSESDADRAPNYVVTPTGARVNRLFAVGVLTEVSPAGEDVLRARIADPTGTFVVYAGQYQPDAQTFLERAEPPAYVAVTGKARTFQPDDSDVVYTSIRPESLNEVDEVTRDRWTVGAAEATLERVGTMATAMELDVRGDELRAALDERGVEPGLAAGIPLAVEHYGTTSGYLAAMRTLATSALEVVAGERDEVESLSLSPDQGGDADLDALAETASIGEPTGVTAGTAEQGESPATENEETPSTGATTSTFDTSASTADASPSADDTASTTADSDAGAASEESASASTADVSGESDAAEGDGFDSDETPEAESATETSEEGGETDTDTPAAETDTPTDEPSEDTADLEDFDGEFELDEDEREQIKDEFGTEFTSGAEVDEPGEAGIETPDEPIEPETAGDDGGTPATEETADEAAPAAEKTDTATEGEPEPAAEEPGSEELASGADESAAEPEDIDLEDAAMDAMATLDDGDGADREAVIERVQDAHGVDAADVVDAIQDALMNGRCYEPSDGRLKSI
ncbi:hypothetical protein [Halorhabdus sp. BNX81]|uniref:hypothetical protein n=1 Tax=Halorhabdus sp. BNX81 TaxID=2980181 RepID=UPI0023DD2A35|nr:hypothetical protein [Halorhabdus sp. BNX81]WEL21107.1 RPA family protein, a subunit of RPA complex in P.furiosus [Halorhabdus sp. BNX81]